MDSNTKRVISVTTPIAAPPSVIFSLIIDLPGYNDWLPSSTAFKGTTSVSETPIRAGTTYVEESPAGTRRGKVTVLDEEARHVRFEQPMRMKPYLLGVEIGITVDMKVLEGGQQGSGVVEREVTLEFPWIMSPVAGLVTRQFETEVKRTMSVMKAHLEGKEMP